MTLEFIIAGGARDGEREVLDLPVVTIGRHPLSDLRFDAEQDRDVSARHAEIRVEDGRAILLDVGSTNGTLLNGKKIATPTALTTGDVVRFGPDGPSVTVTVGDTWASRASRSAAPPRTSQSPQRPASTPAPARAASSPRPVAPAPARGAAPGAGATQERVRVAVRQETRKLSWLFGAGLAVVAAVGGAPGGSRSRPPMRGPPNSQRCSRARTRSPRSSMPSSRACRRRSAASTVPSSAPGAKAISCAPSSRPAVARRCARGSSRCRTASSASSAPRRWITPRSSSAAGARSS